MNTIALFIDLEKTSDSIWLEELLYKLLSVGVPGLFAEIFRHFLYERKIIV